MASILLALYALPVIAVAGPIEKVVTLLEELKAGLENDEKVEEQIYNKYACWCQVTTGHKAAAIHIAHAKIQELSGTVLGLKSKIAVFAQEISDKTDVIMEAEENMKSATAIRQKDNAAFMKESAELMEAINALERAMKVLSGAGTKTGLLQNANALSTSERTRAANLISFAVNKFPTDGSRSLSSKKISALARYTDMLRSDMESLSLDSMSQPEGITAAEDTGGYAPQSATVQGILKDMYDTFATDLESQTSTEAGANRDYEALMAEKTTQVNHMNEEIAHQEELKAAAEVELAESIQELDDTTKQMKADIEFFDLTEAGCRAKHEEWTTRSSQRMEEIKGVEEALKILTSDEARALFMKAIKPGAETSFLQINAGNDESAPASKAYKVLKEQARKSHSIRLAALAATVRTASTGHFDEVIKKIDEMIQTLKEEEKEDIKQRDWCKDEYQKNSEEHANLKWTIETNLAVITKLEEAIAKLDENIQATAQEIKDTKEQIKKMEDERIEENKAFKQAKSDDEAAAALLGKTIDVLSKFYKKEGIDVGALLQGPEFERSQWDAPDAEFSDKGKRSNQSKGIISILTMLKEDLELEIKNGVKDEIAAQEEFEKAKAAAETLIVDLTEKKTNLEAAKSEKEEQKTLEHEKMAENEQSLADNEEYKAKISPDCDWMLSSFQERVEKRKAEMNGLVQAKEFLAASFVQESSSDDDKFSGISFDHLGSSLRR